MITIDQIDEPNSKSEQRRKEQEQPLGCINRDRLNLDSFNGDPSKDQLILAQPLGITIDCPNWLWRAWRYLTSSNEQPQDR